MEDTIDSLLVGGNSHHHSRMQRARTLGRLAPRTAGSMRKAPPAGHHRHIREFHHSWTDKSTGLGSLGMDPPCIRLAGDTADLGRSRHHRTTCRL